MTPFKVSCDHCDASFKISDASKIGKRVKCPKCAELFTIVDPNADDEYGNDFEEEEEEEAPPVRRSPRPGAKSSGKSKKKRSADGPPIAMWAGIGGISLVVVLGVLWATGMFGGGNAKQQVAATANGSVFAALLDRLPGDTEIIVRVRPKDILASTFATELRTPQFDQQLQSPNPLLPGTTVAGIESLTLAMSGVSQFMVDQKMKSADAPVAMPRSAPPFPNDPLIVITLTDSVTPASLNLSAENGESYGGATIYKRPEPQAPGTPPFLSIIDPNSVAIGTEKQIKGLLDQQSASGLSADFQFLEDGGQLSVAICPRGLQQQVERLSAAKIELPQFHKELQKFAERGGKAMGLQLALTTGLEASVVMQGADTAKTAALEADLKSRVQAALDGLATPQMAANPILGQFKPVLEGIKVTTTGDRVSARAVVPKETLLTVGNIGYSMAAPMMGLGAGGTTAAPPAKAP